MPFKKITKECLLCGKVLVLKSTRDIDRKKFCSHSCRATYYRKFIGKGLARVECVVCGSKYEVVRSRLDKTKYCSIRCKHIGMRLKAKKRHLKFCKQCHTIFAAEKKREKYCSGYCGRTVQSNLISLENHPHWNNGSKSKRQRAMNCRGYIKWRKDVFRRDQWTCQECGQVGWKLNAHHIKSWSNCKELRYNISNGITLCKKCHDEFHRGRKEGVLFHFEK